MILQPTLTKVTRTITTITRETCWVELPVDHAEYDTADLDDLITDKACYVPAEWREEEVIDVIDSTNWEVAE